MIRIYTKMIRKGRLVLDYALGLLTLSFVKLFRLLSSKDSSIQDSVNHKLIIWLASSLRGRSKSIGKSAVIGGEKDDLEGAVIIYIGSVRLFMRSG